MFFEYAVEPEALNSWQRARYLLDALTPSRGRFIAEFPRHWKRLVYKSLNCRDVEKKMIEVKLQQLGTPTLVRRKRNFDSNSDWRENAERSHAQCPFRAIVLDGGITAAHHLDGELVDESAALWHVPNGRHLPRDGVALAVALEFLLEIASQVVVVDPYFRGDQPDKVEAVRRIAMAASRGTAAMHLVHGDTHVSGRHVASSSQRVLLDLLPAGFRLSLVCVQQRVGGPRLHNRYILTDRGGVALGDGVERGAHGETDHVAILDAEALDELRNQYPPKGGQFDLVGQTVEIRGRDA